MVVVDAAALLQLLVGAVAAPQLASQPRDQVIRRRRGTPAAQFAATWLERRS